MAKLKSIKSRKKIEATKKLLAYLVLIFACVIVLAPFSIVISTSLKTYPDSVKVPFRFFVGYVDFTSYKEILTDPSIWQGLKNTLFIVVPIMFIGTFNSALSAYAFSKLKFKGRNAMFFTLLASMMLPGIVTMTPAYVIYDMIGWTDTFLPLMIPNAFGTAACTFYLRQYFMGFPDELLEAAELDGLGKFGTFIRILLPLAKPALIAQLILWFIAGYNDYFGPMLYLNTRENYTLQLVVKLMAGSADQRWPKIMSASMIMMAPILLIYLFCQKYFIEGITMSGMKE